MRRMSPLVRRKSGRAYASALALALSLTGGAVVATAVTAAPALAQRQQQPKAGNSENFAKIYQPVATMVNTPGGDIAAAKAQIPGIIAAIETADDRLNAGNLVLVVGNKLSDKALQRQGLELMLQSGKSDPSQLGQLQYFIGSLAYDARDWAAARTAFQAAMAAGYTQDDPEPLIAESYFQEGQNQQGLTYLKGLVDKRITAGQTVPDNWLLRGLQVAYQAKLGEAATEWSALLVARRPTAENWSKALQVVHQLNAFDPKVQIDLFRLMALTNSLTDRYAYSAYVEAIDPRVMASEAARVLDAGLRAGVFNSGDSFYTETKRVADQRAAGERAEADDYATRARQAASGRDAKNAGDLYLGLEAYAQAEEMFKLAVEKGGVDRDEALIRLGIAQVQQGKLAEGRASFEQVSGVRAPLAQLWSAYAESRA